MAAEWPDFDGVIADWCSHRSSYIRNARRRFAATLPALAAAFNASRDNPTMMAIEAATDRGETPGVIISSLVGVGRNAVELLGEVPQNRSTEFWCRRPIQLLWALDLLHGLGPPQTCTEWGLLHRIWTNTGLGEIDDYGSAAVPGRQRQLVLEHLFRSICSGGYADATEALVDRLVAPIPLVEPSPEGIWPIQGYIAFVCSIFDKLVRDNSPSAGCSDSFLARYTAAELIRQWESWRCINAAYSPINPEWAYGALDKSSAQWAMRIVLPDFEVAFGQ